MNRLFCVAAALLVSLPAFSQFKQCDVVSSGGGFAVNKSASVSFTIAESVIGTKTAGGWTIYQGFQQAIAIDGNAGNGVPIVPPSTEIAENDVAANLKIYPNPVDEIMVIDLGKEITFAYSAKCYNVTGNIVYAGNMEGSVAKIDVSSWPQGVYFVQIFNNDELVTYRKVVKQ